MKLSDRVWLLMNKKAPNRYGFYLISAFCWAATGAIWFTALIMATALVSETYAEAQGVVEGTVDISWQIPIALFLIALALTIFLIVFDSKKGYVNALYQHHLSRWKTKRDKILPNQKEV